MNILPLEYKKNGFNYKQLFRDGNYVVYEQRDEEKVVALEVSEVIQMGESIVFGNKVDAREKIPSTEQWGVKGFTVRTLDQALEKIEQMKLKKLNSDQNAHGKINENQ